MTSPIIRILLVALVALLPVEASAQSRFSPVVQVGDATVTRYELDQRTRFLALLGAPGDPRELAREQLINERVQTAAAAEAEVTPSPEEVESGMGEFASRANLTADQFVAALAQNGVDAETFRQFIGAGVAWRSYVRQRFGDSAREALPREVVRRTLAETGTEGGVRVLISEILLPATTPETAAASRARAARLSALGSEEAFSAAARELSVAPSSAAGGALNWVALDGLPDSVRPTIASLVPGQISRPVDLGNAVGVFLLRDIERVPAGSPDALLVDYALFITDGDESAARAVAERVDTCDDLYGVAKGLPEDRLIREERPQAQLPADVRAAIAGLDADEVSTGLVRSGRAAVLMLCDRKPALESTVDLDIVGNRLLNGWIGAMAADHLAQLRANTIVVDLAD